MTNDADFRPQWLDEVAARIMAGLFPLHAKYEAILWKDMAFDAYNAAAALIAEGRRRRGEGE